MPVAALKSAANFLSSMYSDQVKILSSFSSAKPVRKNNVISSIMAKNIFFIASSRFRPV